MVWRNQGRRAAIPSGSSIKESRLMKKFSYSKKFPFAKGRKNLFSEVFFLEGLGSLPPYLHSPSAHSRSRLMACSACARLF